MMTLEASPQALAAIRPHRQSVRAVAVCMYLSMLALLVQAILAGQFVDQGGTDKWVNAHGAVANAAWALPLIALIVAVARIGRHFLPIVAAIGVFLAGALIETGLGHLITDHNDAWAIGVHIPLAMVLVGLGGWLSLNLTRLTRA